MSDKNKLDDMMKLATDNSSKPGGPRRKNSKKILIALPVVIVALLLVTLLVLRPKPQDFVDKTEAPVAPIVNEGSGNDLVDEGTSPGTSPDEIWEFERPVESPEWTKKPFHPEIFEDDEALKGIYEYADRIQGVRLAIGGMPSEIKGDWEGAGEPFTNKTWEQTITNEDGEEVPNNRFKYAVREDYYKAYSTYIQRLINPSFGKWVFAQNNNPTSNNSFDELKDMFSGDWWNQNVKANEDYSKLPVMADWNEDNFGGLELAEYESGRYGTFYGEINETEELKVHHEFMGRDERDVDIIKIVTPIKYVAFGLNDKVERFGTIEMILASNEHISALTNRIVITDIKLTLGNN